MLLLMLGLAASAARAERLNSLKPRKQKPLPDGAMTGAEVGSRTEGHRARDIQAECSVGVNRGGRFQLFGILAVRKL
jgi:hypothetical protein